MTNSKQIQTRLKRTPKRVRHASTISNLGDALNKIEELIHYVRGYDIEFMPQEFKDKIEDLDKWEAANEAEVLYQKAMKSWLEKWKTACDEQIPQHIIVPILRGLTPLQAIILGLLSSNIRTIPMMVDTLQERSRIAVHNAMKGLVSKGLVFRVSASMYFESSWTRVDAKAWAKEYIASNRNPNGVVPRVRDYNFDEVATLVTRVFREKSTWNKVAVHPDDNQDYKEPWNYKKSSDML